MKKIKFLSLISTALVGLALPALAGPRGGGVGFGGGGGGGGHSVVAAVLGSFLAEGLAPHQLSTVAAFEEHQLSAAVAHTLPAEVLAV
jgi:hypothetical protein